MKLLSAGLTFVNISTIAGALLGIAYHGLGYNVALASILIGLVAALLALFGTRSTVPESVPAQAPVATPNLESAGEASNQSVLSTLTRAVKPYRSTWLWLMVAVFVAFAVRSFCNVLFIDSNELKIQNPNNLGDLSLHITYINNFASGVPLWPENPIFTFSKLRYPAGTDLFNALLVSLDISLIRGLVWVGLLSCAAMCFIFYRWGGTFAMAAFLFNGGLAGFQFFKTWDWRDYQGNFIAWKSIALSMIVTQRGLLYSLPAGVLLLYQWRAKYFPRTDAKGTTEKPPLPFWVEMSLYASMPLFHVHTFMALSIVLACLFVFLLPNRWARMQLILLGLASLLPATFFVWLVTDHFHAGSVMQWSPGWVQNDGDFARAIGAFLTPPATPAPLTPGFVSNVVQFFQFWIINFGITIPLIIALVLLLVARAWKQRNDPAPVKIHVVVLLGMVALAVLVAACLFIYYSLGYSLFVVIAIVPPAVIAVLVLPFTMLLYKDWKQSIPIGPALAFVIPAVGMFLFCCLVKTAPWAWDNLKVMIWGYIIVLPFLWTEMISRWKLPIRVVTLFVLFFSGFVTLFGGIAAGRTGFGLANRAELDEAGAAIRQLPLDARFVSFPVFNHPLLLLGRRVVMGYPGHVWTQGFDYGDAQGKIGSIMNGAPNWKELARNFQARYLFWGREEKKAYAQSPRPWEKESKLVASGEWGAVYDLESPKEPERPPVPQPTPVPAGSPSQSSTPAQTTPVATTSQ